MEDVVTAPPIIRFKIIEVEAEGRPEICVNVISVEDPCPKLDVAYPTKFGSVYRPTAVEALYEL